MRSSRSSRPHQRMSSSSVVLRVEIGSNSLRVRSYSASSSVEFWLEFVVGLLGGCGCRWCCTWEGGVFVGRGVGFCWNDGIFWRSSYAGIGLPCAMRGVCAHGSRIVAATDVAVPHDYAVPTDTEHPRVCNTHHPRQKRALAEPTRSCLARLIRPPAPRITPSGTTTPETRTLSRMF